MSAPLPVPLVPFTLLVSVTFKDTASESAFLASMLPYAAWVAANEPNTLQYQLLKSDKPDRGIAYCIIERYADKQRDFIDKHRGSGEFKVFREVLKVLQDEGTAVVEGESYLDVAE